MNKRTIRAAMISVAALLVVGLMGAGASAQAGYSDASVLVDKLNATSTLILEEGQRLTVRSDAVITMDGEKISFGAIPTPKQALPGIIMVQWAPNSDGSTSKLLIRRFLE